MPVELGAGTKYPALHENHTSTSTFICYQPLNARLMRLTTNGNTYQQKKN